MHASSETTVVNNGERNSVNVELRSRIAGKGVGEVESKASATQTRQRHDLTSLVGAKPRATSDTNLRVIHPQHDSSQHTIDPSLLIVETQMKASRFTAVTSSTLARSIPR